MKLYFDTETCGLHGIVVVIQYAFKGEPVEIWDVWRKPVGETLALIEWMCQHEVVAFNLTFDWFHLCKLYTIFNLLDDKSSLPIKGEVYAKEKDGRFGPCVKPNGALDLMLHAQRGPYQCTMERKDIKIRRVPVALAYRLCRKLNDELELSDLLFARKTVKKKWDVYDIEDDLGNIEPDFKNIVLKFAPSKALKIIYQDITGEKATIFDDIMPSTMPQKELGYAPFGSDWIYHLDGHISHWRFNTLAREYAGKDVNYLMALDDHFGNPAPSDRDSILACLVGAVRWRGFAVDVEGMKELKVDCEQAMKQAPLAPGDVKRWITPDLSDMELAFLKGTGSAVLEEIATWEDHPAAIKCQKVLEARKAEKENQLYDKLITAGRFHASFRITGTLSNRMAGSDGLNPQGIKATKKVRSMFPLADGGLVLCGGDFDSFEIVLMEAVYNDEKLRNVLLEGKKIHTLFAMCLFPGNSYDDIMKTKGTDNDLYLKGKTGIYAKAYGGNAFTLHQKVGVPIEVAEDADRRFSQEYPGIAQSQRRIFEMFCSMRQPGGLGHKVEWHEPAEYIESKLGFRRFFTLENKITKFLYDLADDPPKDWKNLKIKVIRRDREQTVDNAVRSAVFGAAFSLQAANMRAAANHEIQSLGAEMTKILQVDIWSLQPVGIHDWVVQPMNVHDEILAPATPAVHDKISEIVKVFVEKYKSIAPLLAVDWKNNMKSWAEK